MITMNMKLAALALSAVVTVAAFAEGDAEGEAETPKAENGKPIVWGFGSYGIYSGYQLYGSLLNSEPTLQGYLEVNVNLPFSVGPMDDFGFVGVGIWSNTDLTGRRKDSYRRAFNENDPNVHWEKTFWFDDAHKWGLYYRTSFIWYYYPHTRRPYTATTMDWNHSFALVNPYVTPFFDWIHEYHESHASLFQFGLRRTFKVTEALSLTPSVTGVIRPHDYNWCFATAGFSEYHNGGWATLKLEMDATWWLSKWFGLFAKVAYCTTVDPDLRDAADHGSRSDYGHYKDFAWGGIGVEIKF